MLQQLEIFANALPRRRLSAVEFEDRLSALSADVAIDGGHIRYASLGDGPTILLLHGIPLSMTTWQDLAFALAPSYRVIAIDMPGYGGSGKAFGDYSLAAISSRIAAFCRAIGIDRTHVVGSSFGAAVATALALKFPALVDKLVLVNSVGIDGGTHAVERAARIGLVRYAVKSALLREELGRRIFRAKLRASYATIVPDEKLVEHYYALLQTGEGAECFLQTLRQFKERELQAWLPALDRAVLLIWGTEDRVLPVRRSIGVQRRLQRCWSTLIPGVGHLPHEEQPDRCAELIDQFLAATVAPCARQTAS